ncbi:MAG: hypothetical protein C0478_14440 [Planctomyces sp.]|nr:hypothetical protein [Planctomyces sp.]
MTTLQALNLWKSYTLAIRKLSIEQAELIRLENYTDLVPLLTNKQQLLDALVEHRREYGEEWRDIRTQAQMLPEAERGPLASLIQEITSLTEELLALEGAATTALSEHQNEVRTALSAASSALAAASAYDSAEFAENRSRVVWES